MLHSSPGEGLHFVVGDALHAAQILLIGKGPALRDLQRSALRAGFINAMRVPNLAAAEQDHARSALNLIIADATAGTDLPPDALARALDSLSPASAPVTVCIVATDAQRQEVLAAGAHNAWLASEQSAFPERLAMNARMGLLQQRLIRQHEDFNARIDARAERLQRALGVLKQAEAHLLLELDRSKVASRRKSEFIAHMSHELRNPLNAISGFSEIMKDELFGPLGNEHYRMQARTIHTASQHLLGIVNGLLDLAKAEAGKLELRSEVVHVQALMQDTVELLAQQAAEASVTLHLQVAEDLPDIESDAGKIRQILINLVSNALKFTPAGGRVTLSAKRDEAAGVMVLVISDTGTGIAPQDIERMMEPYTQGPQGETGISGTGLGLPITKQIVEFLGGTMALQSKVGTGTVITLRLPLQCAQPTRENAARPEVAEIVMPPAPRAPAPRIVLHPVARRAEAEAGGIGL